MTTLDTSFHKRYLEQNLQDEEFLREYENARQKIAQVDAVLRNLDALRIERGLSKAELARRIGKQPAALRRMLNSASNPELNTIVAMAGALDAEVRIVPRTSPMPASKANRTRRVASAV